MEEDTCNDNDGGEDIYTYGVTRVERRDGTASQQYDSCLNLKTLKEYVCEGNDYVREKKIDCPSGTVCYGGVCKDAESVVLDFCEEDDNGRFYNVSGITEVGKRTGSGRVLSSEEFEDKCLDERTLKEYFCSGDEKVGVETKCSPNEKCFEGACLKPKEIEEILTERKAEEEIEEEETESETVESGTETGEN